MIGIILYRVSSRGTDVERGERGGGGSRSVKGFSETFSFDPACLNNRLIIQTRQKRREQSDRVCRRVSEQSLAPIFRASWRGKISREALAAEKRTPELRRLSGSVPISEGP